MLVLEGGDMGHKLSWRIILWAVIYGFFVVPREAACQLDGPHRQKKSLSCEDGETLIHAPAQFTNDQVCGDLVAAPPDYYNEVLLDECQRQLGLENRPSSVHGSSLVECAAFSNGTIRYRTDVCCPGSIAGLRCFTCSDGDRQYDSLISKYNADYCNYQGDVDTCAPDQVCLTHYNISRPISRVWYAVDKRCESAEVCEAAEKNNTDSCVSGRWPSVSCSYCCNDSLCNHPSVWPSRWPGSPPNTDPCLPNPCYYGGTCSELLSSTTTGASSSNYNCTCRPGYNGSRCQTSPCSGQPCKNAGLCYTSSTPPYYYCRCKIGWNTSTDCVEAYPLCDDTKHGGYCQHNGLCYDHGEFGLRCSCPEGFHGSNCELITGVVNQCTFPDAYYRYTYESNSNINCTELSRRVQGYDRVRNCRSYVGSGFQQGLDGDMNDMFMEAIDNYFCERGDVTAFYKYHMCCPPCFRRPCKNGGWCVQTQAGYVCRCRLGYDGAQCQYRGATCLASGDPHYLTFDKRDVSFQGECKHNLVSGFVGADTEPFQVLTRNERRGSSEIVSYVRYVELHIYDHVVRLDRGNRVYVGIHGCSISIHYYYLELPKIDSDIFEYNLNMSMGVQLIQ